jgi:hypothetical protein
MSFLEFTFESLGHFIGMVILFVLFGDWTLKLWNRFWRHWNIRKHGYPPRHCDADGDAVVEEEETIEQ